MVCKIFSNLLDAALPHMQRRMLRFNIGIGYKVGPRFRESRRLLSPSGRGGEFTQPRAHLLADPYIKPQHPPRRRLLSLRVPRCKPRLLFHRVSKLRRPLLLGGSNYMIFICPSKRVTKCDIYISVCATRTLIKMEHRSRSQIVENWQIIIHIILYHVSLYHIAL